MTITTIKRFVSHVKLDNINETQGLFALKDMYGNFIDSFRLKGEGSDQIEHLIRVKQKCKDVTVHTFKVQFKYLIQATNSFGEDVSFTLERL